MKNILSSVRAMVTASVSRMRLVSWPILSETASTIRMRSLQALEVVRASLSRAGARFRKSSSAMCEKFRVTLSTLSIRTRNQWSILRHAISNFEKHVLDTVLWKYFAIAVVLGLSANVVSTFLLGAGEKVALLLFAIFVVIFALVFGNLKSDKVKRETFDLFYYSLAMVAVIGLFVTNEAQREQLTLKEEFHGLVTERKIFEDRLRFLRYVREHPGEVFAQIRVRSRQIADAHIGARDSACRCGARPEECEVPVGVGRVRINDPELRAWKQMQYASQCAALSRAREEEVWIELSNMSTFGELSQLELRKLDQSEATIDGLNVQIADTLSKIVQVTTNPAQAVQQEEAEKAKIEKANGKIVVLQKRFDEPERIEDASSFFSVFMQFTWPYVLIALLGLKIARVDYFSPPS